MAGEPDMPVVPPAGEAVSPELVGEALLASAKRKILFYDDPSPAFKQRIGDDSIKVFKLQAAAALPHVVQQNNLLQRVEQGLQRVEQGLQRMEQGLQRVEQGQQALQEEQQALQQRQERLEQMTQAYRHNEGARRLNRQRLVTEGAAALQPLRREVVAAAGEAHQLGTLPPAGVFPADPLALNNLTHDELNTLETFYGQQFAGNSVLARRKAFQDYVCQ